MIDQPVGTTIDEPVEEVFARVPDIPASRPSPLNRVQRRNFNVHRRETGGFRRGSGIEEGGERYVQYGRDCTR
jgi:hypothetical protein